MLSPQPPHNVKFICGLIYRHGATLDAICKKLRMKLGAIDYESGQVPFRYTDYYYKEMGAPLYRRFISFRKLRSPDSLRRIKLTCIKIEKDYAHSQKRTVNIDPGYLSEASVVLSTTKDFSHRIYLGKGIFAEVTLIYSGKRYVDLPWTYPDYRSKEYKAIFLKVREMYRGQVRDGGGG